MSQAWGVNEYDPEGFYNAFSSTDNVADKLWASIINSDDTHMARACMESGWTPLMQHEDICWRLAKNYAWNMLDWFMQAPSLKETMMRNAAQNPQDTWWVAARDYTSSLERLLDLGMNIAQRNSKGQTIAHYALGYHSAKEEVARWFVHHHPHMLEEQDCEGCTPLDHIQSIELKTRIEAELLDATTRLTSRDIPNRSVRL